MSNIHQTVQPTLKDALKYVIRIRQLFENEPSNYEYFKTSLISYFQAKIDERTLIVRMENLFQECPDIRNELYWYCSPTYWNIHQQSKLSPPSPPPPLTKNQMMNTNSFII